MSDHRAAQSPVLYQGERETCVGFAVSAAHEWMAQLPAPMSPEDAMWAAHDLAYFASEAVSVRRTLQALVTRYHATEAAWPYGAPRWPAGRPAPALDPANQFPLPSWREIGVLTFDAVETELSAAHAVVVTLALVRSAWRRPGGVIDAPADAKIQTNHAVLAVGTTHNRELIIKNSWGHWWGAAGYGFVSERYLDAFGLCAHVIEP